MESDRLRCAASAWASEVFGLTQLHHATRTQRLVSMATHAAVRPAGRISAVFTSAADSQAAYDFLESRLFDEAPIRRAICEATVELCADEPVVFVPVDGSAVSVVDRTHAKDLGSIGTLSQGSRGLKVITAMCVSLLGDVLGLCDQVWWARCCAQPPSKRNDARSVGEKETRFWHAALEHVVDLFESSRCRCWFQVDREADSWSILRYLSTLPHWFTVRSNRDRIVLTAGKSKSKLRSVLRRRRVVGHYSLEVPAGPGRSPRVARMAVRTTKTTLLLRDKKTGRQHPTNVNAVWACEVGPVPNGDRRIDWVLLTNYPVDTLEQVRRVLYGYRQRWRIEDFHRTWKSGHCDIESSQLRSQHALRKWATLMAAVAMRVERIKHLSRTQPDLPASAELSATELQALLLMKHKYAKHTERITDDMLPTIAQATEWIARLGGYTGKSSGGPPGSITIGRGLEYLRAVADGLDALGQRRRKTRRAPNS